MSSAAFAAERLELMLLLCLLLGLLLLCLPLFLLLCLQHWLLLTVLLVAAVFTAGSFAFAVVSAAVTTVLSVLQIGLMLCQLFSC